MKFTDIFIKRPVLSSVVSLLILIIGLVALFNMPVRQYPAMDNTTITITTSYPGASPDVVQGFITNVISQSVGSADGIDYMYSQSTIGLSTINIYIKLNYDPNAALTDISGKVNAVLAELPKGALSPSITKTTGQTMPDLMLGFTSKSMNAEQISAYLANVLAPAINSLGGISQIAIMGQKQYAMRIWLYTNKMAALGVTTADIESALNSNNVQTAGGSLKSQYLYTDLNVETDLHTADQFDNLVVKNEGGRLIRIRDVGKAELGAQNYDTQVFYNNQNAVFLGIFSAPDANPLSVVNTILSKLPAYQAMLPPGLQVSVVHDLTEYIRASIQDVIRTIIEAVVIVIIVIFLFLGALRAVLIPVVTIPLSLIGVCSLMLAMGFSINLLTLLAMVLAIGLVVDDAIVVLENIYRHIETGLSPFDAAIQGAREIIGPVIVMTLTLAAVFAPIGFMGGLTGALFKEFTFTLAASVIISGIVALSFSPMLASKIINRRVTEARLVKKVDELFYRFRVFYQARLTAALVYRRSILAVAAVVLISCYFLFLGTKSELAPTEDQSFIAVTANAPSGANLNYLLKYNPQLQKILSGFPESASTFQVDGHPSVNQVFAGVRLTDWSARTRTQMQLAPLLQKQLNQIPGLKAFAAQMPPLPGVSVGPPVQFVVSSTADFPALAQVMDELMKQAQQSGLFTYVDDDLKFDKPMINIAINRSKAGDLGISMSAIADAMNVMLGGNLVNYFNAQGYSFQVIPQLPDDLRVYQQQLDNIQLSTSSGALVPLSSLISSSSTSEPASLNQFDQLNSATLSAIPAPGVSQGQALAYLQQTARQYLPTGMSYDYTGQSRQYVQEGNSLLYAFVFALIIIFLLLAAQFESFRDPLIILVSVPMSICGALLPLYLGAATMNIYTEIGLITLVGLISKHGILMVEFANKLQETENLSIHEAIIKAAAIRLRPILMTTFAMIFGVVPLIIATGAGAVSRFDVGFVIACGMLVGTCFTLFVVPTMYTFLAKKHVITNK